MMTTTALIDESFELLGGVDFNGFIDAALGLDPLAKECPEDVPCRVSDQDLWFADAPAELEQAKQLCLGCPARLACLSGAADRREPWGVWGGELFERGAIVARKRPRGRPRKDAAADARFSVEAEDVRPSVQAEGDRTVVAA